MGLTQSAYLGPAHSSPLLTAQPSYSALQCRRRQSSMSCHICPHNIAEDGHERMLQEYCGGFRVPEQLC